MEILAAIISHWDMLLVPAAWIYLGAWLAFLFWKQRS